MKLPLLALAAAAAGCMSPGAAASSSASSRPNILLIVADDLGYNGLGYMNTSRGILSPNLDRLANEGVSLHNYYVQPICSPTRSALMSGRYPMHIGTQSNVIFWDTPWGVPLAFDMLPEMLKAHGDYDTAMFGKWHLGMFKEDYTPWKRGFDDYLGYMQGCGSAYTHISACCGAGSIDNDTDYVCPGPKWVEEQELIRLGETKQQQAGEEDPLDEGPAAEDYRAWDWFNGSSTAGFFPDFSANHTNSAFLIRDAAVAFLERRSADLAEGEDHNPFFLYLPFQNVHSPYTCDPKYFHLYDNVSDTLGPYTRGMFGYISEMDDMVGSVRSALERTGLYNNTWIIFTSDNGAPPAPNVTGRNFPLRGHKASIWEGGIRVPGFVHSPLLPDEVKGTQSHELYHVTDWLPTILDIAGVTQAPPQTLDGSSILHSLVTGTASPRTEIVANVNPLCSSPTDSQAGPPRAGIRIGDMKLLVPCFEVAGINGSTSTGPVTPPFQVRVPEGGDSGSKFHGPDTWPMLFNVTADIGESTNLAKEMPDVVEKLLKRLTELASTMVEPMQWEPPFQGANYSCATCPKANNLGGPAKPAVPWL